MFDKGGIVARRANYGFEKRQREMKKKAKAEQKLERKRAKKAGFGPDDGSVVEERTTPEEAPRPSIAEDPSGE